MRIKVMGLDAALTNCGVAVATVDTEAQEIVQIDYLHTLTTAKTKERNTRVSSDNVRRCRSIFDGLRTIIADHGVKFFFAEVPYGGKTAKVATAFGMVQAILAGQPIPMFEVTPLEVKERSVGDKHADKPQIMQWAATLPLGPDAKWRTGKTKNQMNAKIGDQYLQANEEHVADACAAIQAGITGNEFRRALAMLSSFI